MTLEYDPISLWHRARVAREFVDELLFAGARSRFRAIAIVDILRDTKRGLPEYFK